MAREGMASLFPIEELSIMGFSAVVKKLPKLLRLIRETASAVTRAAPDILVIIDSPDFTHRVARRVRARDPSLPIIDYVSPTVWAWRPGRARAMLGYVDHVLALLPSNRRRIAGFTVRPAVMSVIPWSSKSMCFVPMPANNGAGTAATAGSAGAAGKPPRRSQPSHGGIRRNAGPAGPAVQPVLPALPHLQDLVREGVKSGRSSRGSSSANRKRKRHSASRARLSSSQAPQRSNWRSPGCRWSPPTGWEPWRP